METKGKEKSYKAAIIENMLVGGAVTRCTAQLIGPSFIVAQREIIFEILSNQPEIRLYLTFSG